MADETTPKETTNDGPKISKAAEVVSQHLSGDKVSMERVLAPELPVPGSIVASPLTGGGHHRRTGGIPMPSQRPPKGPPKAPKGPPRVSDAAAAESKVSEQPDKKPVVHSHPAGDFLQGMSNDPALLSLIMETLGARKQTAQKFILLTLPEDDYPRCQEFDTVSAMIEVIKGLLGTYTHVFAFLGQRLTISAGQFRYLHTPMGALPLWDVPDPAAITETEYGWVGPALEESEVPENQDVDDNDLVGDEATVDETDVNSDIDDEDTPTF